MMFLSSAFLFSAVILNTAVQHTALSPHTQGMISIKTLSKLAQLRHEGVMLVCNLAPTHMYVTGQVKQAALNSHRELALRGRNCCGPAQRNMKDKQHMPRPVLLS